MPSTGIATIIVVFLSVGMIIAALAALYTSSRTAAVLIAGAVSLIASLLFLLNGAPDVAMTEATVGSALTTVVFLLALRAMRNKDNS
jgi:energy-converting hydrogenase B subunit D